MTISIHMNCYSNASIILSSSTILYNNITLQSCQCFMTQQNISGFQYDNNEKSCYTFGNDSSRSNLRIKINSQVCFVDQTSTFYSETTTMIATLPSPPITMSTSVTGNNYYETDSISLTNNVSLTSLSIIITVPKTFGVSSPSSYTTFWSNTVTNLINETSDSVLYTFQLINGTSIVSGQWQIAAQFNLDGQIRSTSNDTYLIQIQSYQDISGHF